MKSLREKLLMERVTSLTERYSQKKDSLKSLRNMDLKLWKWKG